MNPEGKRKNKGFKLQLTQTGGRMPEPGRQIRQPFDIHTGFAEPPLPN
jgi:hypothetical protein